MRNSLKIFAAAILCISCTAFGAGSGQMPTMGSGGMDTHNSGPQSPEDQARTQFNAGVRAVEKADELGADATRQTDAKKQAKVAGKSKTAYVAALKRFMKAVEFYPSMHEAWNYIGYSNRKLGNFEAALVAYDRALSLRPGYLEAIEYRGHAFLGLNRLSEAKETYLTLFASNRKLASQLLVGMQAWVGNHRNNADGIDNAMLESFASWVSERSTIASRTAGLTREGGSAAW